MRYSESLSRVATFLLSIALYLPVIAGILTPMVWLLASWYFAWDILAVILPFSELMSGLWLVGLNDTAIGIIRMIEIFVVLIGIAIFLLALKEMANGRVKGEGLVTTGPYSHVRHPQHLGIAIFLLPLSLFKMTLRTNFTGIRPGDIVSWLFVLFLLLVSADIEEARLLRTFGDRYVVFREKTAFFIPKLRIRYPVRSDRLGVGRPLRYILWFVVFWTLASFIMYMFTFVELRWTL